MKQLFIVAKKKNFTCRQSVKAYVNRRPKVITEPLNLMDPVIMIQEHMEIFYDGMFHIK